MLKIAGKFFQSTGWVTKVAASQGVSALLPAAILKEKSVDLLSTSLTDWFRGTTSKKNERDSAGHEISYIITCGRQQCRKSSTTSNQAKRQSQDLLASSFSEEWLRVHKGMESLSHFTRR